MKTWKGYYSIWPRETSFGEEVYVTLPDEATAEEISKAIRDEIDQVWSMDDLDYDEPHWKQNEETGRWETETGNGYPIEFNYVTEVLPIIIRTKDPTTTVENLPESFQVEIASRKISEAVEEALEPYKRYMNAECMRHLKEAFCMLRCVPTLPALYAFGYGYIRAENIGPARRTKIMNALYGYDYLRKEPSKDKRWAEFWNWDGDK